MPVVLDTANNMCLKATFPHHNLIDGASSGDRSAQARECSIQQKIQIGSMEPAPKRTAIPVRMQLVKAKEIQQFFKQREMRFGL